MNRPDRINRWMGLGLAALVACLNFALWQAWNRPVLAPEHAGQVAGFAYNAFQRWDSPILKRYPGNEAIESDLVMLSDMTRRIRTYSSAEFPALPRIAADHGLRVTAGVWLDGRPANDRLEIEAAKEAARRHRNIERLIVGNETLLKGSVGIEQLVAYLNEVRRAARVPVSTAEPWHIWLRYPELARHVDFITVHLLPYWEGVPSEFAVDYALRRYEQIRLRFPNKHVVIGEIGWPSRGDRLTASGSTATASPLEQARFIREFLDRVKGQPVDYFIMEAIDQPWKAFDEGRVGAYWGVFDADRKLKFELRGLIEPDGNWWKEAGLASALGFLAMAIFAWVFARLRLASRLTYFVFLQAVASFLVWLLALPFDQYLRASDWVALAVLAPTLLLMAAIVLANGFEFVEMFWSGNLRRRFETLPGVSAVKGGPAASGQARVCIHLACCNEAPEMVIATLESLVRLDYPRFEVLVVDNNTRDESLWRPVERWVQASGDARLRFVHLPRWPGFKAGALNFALSQTAQDVDIIGVVDADYVVRPDWLSSLVAHFSDPEVAVVQTPQAHRAWETHPFHRMMNWEYEGFFRIGMHHRNERDAIIQHGTMTLIRASALRNEGRWSEWCICEDAELGLRLMKAGYRSVYVDRVMGQGLTPDDFGAFKQQRRRWAEGGMQILRHHLASLLGRSRLSLAQRYHFVAGWLPWIGDALHLLFSFGAMAWTIGVLASPRQFHYPIALYMVPLVVFFGFKALFGPLLYLRRVGCAVRDVAGAALAGMGLSHAIAQGVFAGLVRREGIFEITRKGRAARRTGLAAAREEALLWTGLMVCVAAVALTRKVNHLESALWMGVLCLQAFPYAAALACATLSMRAAKAEWVPGLAILPDRPVSATLAPAGLPAGLTPPSQPLVRAAVQSDALHPVREPWSRISSQP